MTAHATLGVLDALIRWPSTLTLATKEDGTCSFPGCTNELALNFQRYANVEDGTCAFEPEAPCPADLDGDGAIATGDLLLFLGTFGQICM